MVWKCHTSNILNALGMTLMDLFGISHGFNLLYNRNTHYPRMSKTLLKFMDPPYLPAIPHTLRRIFP